MDVDSPNCSRDASVYQYCSFFNIVQNALTFFLNIGWGNSLHLAFWKVVVSCLLLANKLGLVSTAGFISLISPLHLGV